MNITKRNRILDRFKNLNIIYKLIHIPDIKLTASYSAKNDVCILIPVSIIISTLMMKLRYAVDKSKRHNGSKIPISRKTHERVFGNTQHPL